MISSRPDLAAVLAFGSAALLTALIVPLVRQLGLRWGLIDQPDPRKQHTTPMVRLGGVGIVSGFVLGLLLIWRLGGFVELPPQRDALIWTTLAGSLCYFVIGLADDLFGRWACPEFCGALFTAEDGGSAVPPSSLVTRRHAQAPP